MKHSKSLLTASVALIGMVLVSLPLYAQSLALKVNIPFEFSVGQNTLPAGTYTVETIDATLDNLSFVAYRRISTSIMVPADGRGQRQVIFIDPKELEAALKLDAQRLPV